MECRDLQCRYQRSEHRILARPECFRPAAHQISVQEFRMRALGPWDLSMGFHMWRALMVHLRGNMSQGYNSLCTPDCSVAVPNLRMISAVGWEMEMWAGDTHQDVLKGLKHIDTAICDTCDRMSRAQGEETSIPSAKIGFRRLVPRLCRSRFKALWNLSETIEIRPGKLVSRILIESSPYLVFHLYRCGLEAAGSTSWGKVLKTGFQE